MQLTSVETAGAWTAGPGKKVEKQQWSLDAPAYFPGKIPTPQGAGRGCCQLGWSGRRVGGPWAGYACASPRNSYFSSLVISSFPSNRSSALGQGFHHCVSCLGSRRSEQNSSSLKICVREVGRGIGRAVGGSLMFSFYASVLLENFASVSPGMKE